MICVPITGKTTERAIEDIRRAESIADILEIRFDCIKNPDVEKIMKATGKPKIVTNRKKSEGGFFEGSESERIRLLRHAVDFAHRTDIELGSWASAASLKSKRSKLIVSYHNFHETPKNLEDIYKKAKKTGCDIIKIATFANDITDNIRIIELAKKARKEGQKIIALCMGEKGEIS